MANLALHLEAVVALVNISPAGQWSSMQEIRGGLEAHLVAKISVSKKELNDLFG